ncbi:MAG: alpha-ribazole phosphatase [Nitrospirae bacterium]|nr:alpha-ribazole phosphatase [Nitrospirota bacterium]
MLTKLYLIRHGETEGAETKRYKGHIDVPLSENGIEQIRRLAEYLNNSPIPLLSKSGQKRVDVVYCSDLSRAVKSAEIIAEPYGLKPVIMPELRERNFGLWEGMSFDEIREKWPDAFNAWADNPLEFSPMNGESTIELRDRALKVFSEIIGKHQGEHIAIVAHGGINRVILCHLLGIPLENIFRVEQDYGCLNIVEMWDYPVVTLINGGFNNLSFP